MSNSKRKLILLIAVIFALSLFAVSVLAGNTSIVSVGFTLVKSAGSVVTDSVSIGFSLVKSALSSVSSTLSVGFTLVKSMISSTTSVVSIGFSLIKQAISIVFATINTTFHLSPTPTPTPTPPPSNFYVQITSTNCPVYINQTAYFNATAGGTDLVYPLTFYWEFGDGANAFYFDYFKSTINVTHVYPSYWRSWYVKVSVIDNAGHVAEDSIKCCVVRTKTDEYVDTIDDSAYYALLNALVGQTFEGPINESAEPDFIEFGKSVTIPYTNILGSLFFVIFFGAFFIMMWLRQGNIMIPSTIGIIVGGVLLKYAPAEFRLPAILFISFNIFGIIYTLLKERS